VEDAEDVEDIGDVVEEEEEEDGGDKDGDIDIDRHQDLYGIVHGIGLVVYANVDVLV